jgi:sec-independent protein translocase protein TatB
MFSLGFGEILVICVILILVVGPERLPTVMKGVGKTMRTVREASREIRSTVGLDELMRDDPPRPMYRPPPPATVARIEPPVVAPVPSLTDANSAPAANGPITLSAETAVSPSPATNDPAATAVAPAPAPAPAGVPTPASPTPPTDPDKAGA